MSALVPRGALALARSAALREALEAEVRYGMRAMQRAVERYAKEAVYWAKKPFDPEGEWDADQQHYLNQRRAEEYRTLANSVEEQLADCRRWLGEEPPA